mgnify:CR=1 FL=1
MKDRTKNTPQVLLRRALLVLLDAAIVAFSFYFALLLRADGAVEAGWWPHNRALLYENLPWIVAVYIVCFLAGGLYSVLWKYAGERDLIRLAGMIAVPTAVVLCGEPPLYPRCAVQFRQLHGLGAHLFVYRRQPLGLAAVFEPSAG